MNGKLRWIYPAFGGLLTLTSIRIAGDIYSEELFWRRPIDITISEIVITAAFGYFFDFIARKQLAYIRRLENLGKHLSMVWEYLMWELLMFVSAIVCVCILHLYAHFDHDIPGYIIAMMMTALCGTSMYIALRNTFIAERVREQNILLEQLKSEHLETELQLLKSQYHPHFLFNALNTIYFQINEQNTLPRYTIEKLSDLLRYQLYTIDEKVDIAQEIAYVNSYIELMKMRKNDDLKLTIHMDEFAKGFKIYPLLFQPLVENAFKYVGGANYITIFLQKESNSMTFIVRNSIPSIQKVYQHKGKGLGIENLKRRLDLLYPAKYLFSTCKEENEFVAQLTLMSVA